MSNHKLHINPDNDPRGPWKPRNLLRRHPMRMKPLGWYAITNPKGEKVLPPNEEWIWRIGIANYHRLELEKLLYWGPSDSYKYPKIKVFYY